MATFADIRKVSDIPPMTTHLKGEYFEAVAVILGIHSIYLLKGAINQDEAEILGVTTISKNLAKTAFVQNSYIGSGLKGGTYIRTADSFEETFASIME